jgi:hypothetical protein
MTEYRHHVSGFPVKRAPALNADSAVSEFSNWVQDVIGTSVGEFKNVRTV